MLTELISIPTPTHPLDGAYYTPDGPSKRTAPALARSRSFPIAITSMSARKGSWQKPSLIG